MVLIGLITMAIGPIVEIQLMTSVKPIDKLKCVFPPSFKTKKDVPTFDPDRSNSHFQPEFMTS